MPEIPLLTKEQAKYIKKIVKEFDILSDASSLNYLISTIQKTIKEENKKRSL